MNPNVLQHQPEAAEWRMLRAMLGDLIRAARAHGQATACFHGHRLVVRRIGGAARAWIEVTWLHGEGRIERVRTALACPSRPGSGWAIAWRGACGCAGRRGGFHGG